jgi:hypothetical protein
VDDVVELELDELLLEDELDEDELLLEDEEDVVELVKVSLLQPNPQDAAATSAASTRTLPKPRRFILGLPWSTSSQPRLLHVAGCVNERLRTISVRNACFSSSDDSGSG